MIALPAQSSAASAAQAELPLRRACPLDDRPAGDRGSCPEGYCFWHQIRWNGSEERLDHRDGLLDAAAARAAFEARIRAEDAEREAKAARKAAAGEEDKLEAEVQEEVCKALHKLAERDQLHYERINAGGHYNDQGQYVRSAATGIADVLVWVAVERPRADGSRVAFSVGLALECKRPGGKQSEAQRRWAEKFCRRSRGYYFLVTSGAEALSAVERARRLEGGAP